MTEITLQLPDETPLAMRVSAEQVGNVLRMAAAVKLFELQRLSSGAAAALAGIPRVAFLAKLADYGVNTFDLTEEDLAKETPLA
jgi:predicted HTH domain antitoxin